MSQWSHSAQSCCVTQGYYPVHPMGATCCPGVYQPFCHLCLPPASIGAAHLWNIYYDKCSSVHTNYVSTRMQVHVKKKIGLRDFPFQYPKYSADTLHLFSPTSAPSIQTKTLSVSPKQDHFLPPQSKKLGKQQSSSPKSLQIAFLSGTVGSLTPSGHSDKTLTTLD